MGQIITRNLEPPEKNEEASARSICRCSVRDGYQTGAQPTSRVFLTQTTRRVRTTMQNAMTRTLITNSLSFLFILVFG